MVKKKLSDIKDSYRTAAKEGNSSESNTHVSSNCRVEPSERGAWVHIQVWIPIERIK